MGERIESCFVASECGDSACSLYCHRSRPPRLENLASRSWRNSAGSFLVGILSRRARHNFVAETQPLAKTLKIRGWISDLQSSRDTVYLVAETAAGPCLAYEVVFAGSKKPQVHDKRGLPLPPKIAVRHKARAIAIVALEGKFFDINYNFEVLDDPDGSGFLVYALAATNKREEIPTGGHYRVTISADGSRVERVDLLSQFIMQKREAGKELAFIVATQLADDRPVETWLYSNHLYRIPIMISTRDRSTWLINKGKMHKFTRAELRELESPREEEKMI